MPAAAATPAGIPPHLMADAFGIVQRMRAQQRLRFACEEAPPAFRESKMPDPRDPGGPLLGLGDLLAATASFIYHERNAYARVRGDAFEIACELGVGVLGINVMPRRILREDRPDLHDRTAPGDSFVVIITYCSTATEVAGTTDLVMPVPADEAAAAADEAVTATEAADAEALNLIRSTIQGIAWRLPSSYATGLGAVTAFSGRAEGLLRAVLDARLRDARDAGCVVEIVLKKDFVSASAPAAFGIHVVTAAEVAETRPYYAGKITPGVSFGLAVCFDEDAGGALVAMETVLPTATIEGVSMHCYYCSATDKPLMLCTGCVFARYCSPSCQRKDWRRCHRVMCRRGEVVVRLP